MRYSSNKGTIIGCIAIGLALVLMLGFLGYVSSGFKDWEITQSVQPPKDGITPHIGENGNWFIGCTDTGVPAQGESSDGLNTDSYTELFSDEWNFKETGFTDYFTPKLSLYDNDKKVFLELDEDLSKYDYFDVTYFFSGYNTSTVATSRFIVCKSYDGTYFYIAGDALLTLELPSGNYYSHWFRMNYKAVDTDERDYNTLEFRTWVYDGLGTFYIGKIVGVKQGDGGN